MYKFDNRETLYEQVFKFFQEGNTMGTTSETEEINVTVVGSVGDIREEGGFFVLDTKGWSINSVLDLLAMFKDMGDKDAEKLLHILELIKEYSEDILYLFRDNPELIPHDVYETFKNYLKK